MGNYSTSDCTCSLLLSSDKFDDTRKRKAYNFFDYSSNSLLETWDAIDKSGQNRSSYYYLGGTLEYTFERDKHRLFAIGGYNQELTNKDDWDQWSMVSLFAKANYTLIVVIY